MDQPITLFQQKIDFKPFVQYFSGLQEAHRPELAGEMMKWMWLMIYLKTMSITHMYYICVMDIEYNFDQLHRSEVSYVV
jgi:hypothetical protein